MLNLKGKIALVTGGSKGIGLAVGPPLGPGWRQHGHLRALRRLSGPCN